MHTFISYFPCFIQLLSVSLYSNQLNIPCMKVLFINLCLFIICSCVEDSQLRSPRAIISNDRDSAIATLIECNMIYYKSAATGNCYAVSKSSSGSSYSGYPLSFCVPCASLNGVKVYVIGTATARDTTVSSNP